jgi:excisionase family DNA binding protein
MITIPINSNTGIRIPARTPPEKPDRKRAETIERISVSVQEAVDTLGISRPSFYRLIKDGTVRTVKIGRRTLVSTKSLRELVDGKEPTKKKEKSDYLQGENE